YFPDGHSVIPVATRGFPALATDFICEDLLVDVVLADFRFRLLGRETDSNTVIQQVEMTPRTDALRAELGYSKAVGWVREDIWLIARADYYDDAGAVFKT